MVLTDMTAEDCLGVDNDHLCGISVCDTDWIISLQGLPGPPGKPGLLGKKGPRVSVVGHI